MRSKRHYRVEGVQKPISSNNKIIRSVKLYAYNKPEAKAISKELIYGFRPTLVERIPTD